MYMDDIKLYANGDRNMSRLINLLHKFKEDTNLTLGIDKCATLHVNNNTIDQETTHSLPTLNPETGYKYLGLIESSMFHQCCIKENAKKSSTKQLQKSFQQI